MSKSAGNLDFCNPDILTFYVLEYSNEEPYIFDEKQIGFYLTRNIKTTALLIILSFIIFNSFGLFWESLNTFLDNLL